LTKIVSKYSKTLVILKLVDTVNTLLVQMLLPQRM